MLACHCHFVLPRSWPHALRYSSRPPPARNARPRFIGVLSSRARRPPRHSRFWRRSARWACTGSTITVGGCTGRDAIPHARRSAGARADGRPAPPAGARPRPWSVSLSRWPRRDRVALTTDGHRWHRRGDHRGEPSALSAKCTEAPSDNVKDNPLHHPPWSCVRSPCKF